MKLTPAQHTSLAAQIYQAQQAGKSIQPPSWSIEYDFDDAYQIRRIFVDLQIAAGAQTKGHKLGFTSLAMQQLYGMTGPDFGILLDTMFCRADQPVRVRHLSDVRVEPEIAFELGRSLTGPGVTIQDVLDATIRVWPAIEVIDSRVGGLQARANDSLADNAGAGLIILGTTSLAPSQIDWKALKIAMNVDGFNQFVSANDVMGHPAAPLAFLANKLSEINGLGGALNAGDIVITGSPMQSVPIMVGSHLQAHFGVLKGIELTFC